MTPGNEHWRKTFFRNLTHLTLTRRQVRKIENNDRNQALGVRHTLSALVAVGLRDLTHKPVLTR